MINEFKINTFLDETDRNIPEGSVTNEALQLMYDLCPEEGWQLTTETGTGRTTVLLSHLSKKHVVFALEASPNLSAGGRKWEHNDNVEYVLGSSQITVPGYKFQRPLEFVLIDGPHAYPYPELEYYHFYPKIKEGGWLVVDDVNIPTINNMFRFLCEEPMFRFHARVGHTAFFQRTSAALFNPLGDDWWVQSYNVNHIDELKPWTIRAKILVKKFLGRS